jgi:ABC-type sugar transport system substrate-binding protein
MEVPAVMGAIRALKEQGLTGPVVVRTFIHHKILPLRERVHPLWQY